VLHAFDAGEPVYLSLGFEPAKEMLMLGDRGICSGARGLTEKASSALAAKEDTAKVATGGIDLDAQFRPRFEKPLIHNLFCVSIPFLLHKLPFV